MKRWRNIALVVLMSFLMFSAASADKEVTFGGEVYSQWYYDLSDTLNAFGNRSQVDFDSYSHFDVTRAYITGKAKLSEKTYGRITVDVEPMLNVMRLKYGYVGWRFFESEQLMLGTELGLVEIPYIYNMDKIWGRRYISMTPSEMSWHPNALGMQSSADYGLSFWSKFGEKGKWGKAFLSFLSGTSYKTPGENNPTKDIDFTFFLTPLNAQPDFAESKIGFQFNTGKVNTYSDSSQTADDFKKTILSVVADFRYAKLFNLGLEYNSYTSPYVLDVLDAGLNNFAADQSDMKINSFSIFGGLWFGELMPDTKAIQTINLFFRYIMLDPDADDHDNVGYGAAYEVKANQMIIGAECAPIKGFKASLNFQSDKITDFGAGIDD
ncbi:MAG: hypothetical protein JSU85_14575, partial [Candidatus Zixiibacteriota bacterium]